MSIFRERPPLMPFVYEITLLAAGGLLSTISDALLIFFIAMLIFGGAAGSLAYGREANKETGRIR